MIVANCSFCSKRYETNNKSNFEVCKDCKELIRGTYNDKKTRYNYTVGGN
jgi:hypothetical protein